MEQMTVRELKRQIASIPEQFDQVKVESVDFTGHDRYIRINGGVRYGSLDIEGTDERQPWLPELRVHVLWHGFPVCGFSEQPPNHWSIHDVWVSKDDLEHANCENCKLGVIRMADGGVVQQ